MDINVYVDNYNIKHISVVGEITFRDEINMFLDELEAGNLEGYNITFFDCNMLHSDIVEKLHAINKYSICRIYVFKRFLYSYLYNMGIKCELVNKKSLKKQRKSVKIDEEVSLENIKSFLDEMYLKYGYDYRGYQADSIIRRIKVSMLREGIGSFKEFRSLVLEDVNIFEQLFMDFSINTTEFFRDPEVFLVIRNKILPYLDSYMHIKIWCVGCSNGKEAYSLAILLEELGLLYRTQIYATDINPYIIEEAKNGLFPINDLEKDVENYKTSGGKKDFIDYFDIEENYVKIKSHIKKNILFFQHSVIGDGSLNEFELILCRNVLIYFDPILQKKVLKNLCNSLEKSGFLVLGKNEGMLLNEGEEYFSSYMTKERIYRVRQPYEK